MAELSIDLDQLALRLRTKMEAQEISLRVAAEQIGVGAATLSRLLRGSENSNLPDLANVNKAAEWLGLSVADLAPRRSGERASTLADVELHLRALPGLDRKDAEVLVGMVRASYDAARKLRAKN